MSNFPLELKEIRGKYFVLGDMYFSIFPYPISEGVNTKNGIVGTLIGEDNCGIPIFYEPQSNNKCIYSLSLPYRGKHRWLKLQIADSFSAFIEACKLLESISINRYSREEYNSNKLSLGEINEFLGVIQKLNPNSNIYFWENIFENIHPNYRVKHSTNKGIIINGRVIL